MAHLLFIPSLFFVLALNCSAQSQATHVHTASLPSQATMASTSVLVDGATNPNGIPDDVAYLHFFRVLARDPRASSEQADDRRRLSYLKHYFGGNALQGSLVRRPLSDLEFRSILESAQRIADKLAALSGTETGSPTISAERRREVVLAAAGDLDQELGAEMAQLVRWHGMSHVKTRIKIVKSTIPADGRPEKESVSCRPKCEFGTGHFCSV